MVNVYCGEKFVLMYFSALLVYINTESSTVSLIFISCSHKEHTKKTPLHQPKRKIKVCVLLKPQLREVGAGTQAKIKLR